MPKTILAAAAALLMSASVTLAQPPGITAEMINRSLPPQRVRGQIRL